MREINPELEILERATSATQGPVAGSSADEAALHEGWSALAHVVAATDAAERFDELAFLEKLARGIDRDHTKSRRAGRGSSLQISEAPRRTWLLLLATLAATIVVCASAGIYFAGQQWGGLMGNKQASDKETKVGDRPAELANSNVPRAVVEEGLGWDDSLDDQIQYVNHSLYQLESGDSVNDRSYRSFGTQLEQFGQEIEVDSL